MTKRRTTYEAMTDADTRDMIPVLVIIGLTLAAVIIGGTILAVTL